MISVRLPHVVVWFHTVFVAMVLNATAGELEMNYTNTTDYGWVFFSDQVMGGQSKGEAQVLSEAGNQFIRLKGIVTTANNGGFIQIRTSVAGLEKNLKGISLKVRGNGQRYYVFIRTSGTMLPWQYYKADFLSKPEWIEVNLELKNFIPSSAWLRKTIRPDSIKSIGIVAFGRDHKALIDVASLRFF